MSFLEQYPQDWTNPEYQRLQDYLIGYASGQIIRLEHLAQSAGIAAGTFPIHPDIRTTSRELIEEMGRQGKLYRLVQEAAEQDTVYKQRFAALLSSGEPHIAKLSGEQFRQLDQARQQQVQSLPNRGQVITGQAKQNGRMGLAMDGAMVHVLDEGWKELRVGCVYEIEPQAVFDKESREWLEMGHAVHNSYVAHLGGPELFGRLLWTEAQQRGWQAVYDTQVVGDGARWIWNLTQEHFYDSYQTIDWYHAADHLHAAAQLYRPDSESAAQRWYKSAETSLFQGHADARSLYAAVSIVGANASQMG